MELETLSCNNCGAPIDVPESANFVNCAHCGSRLAVKHTPTANYTEVIEKLEQRANRFDEKIQNLEIDNELLRLDQYWEEERRDYMVSTRDGGKVEPTMGRAISGLVGVAVIVFSVCFFLLPNAGSGSGSSASGIMFIFLLIAVGVAIFAAVDGFMKYNAYKEAEAAYYQRRADVEARRRRTTQF